MTSTEYQQIVKEAHDRRAATTFAALEITHEADTEGLDLHPSATGTTDRYPYPER